MSTFRRMAMAAVVAGLAAAPLAGCKQVDSVKAALTPCHECGTVAAIERIKEKGEASGAGAVLGAVTGAVIGHQFGGGRGKDMSTAAGAIAGGITGHQVERRINAVVHYHVTVTMNDGGSRAIDVPELNGLAVGSKVKVVGDQLELASG